MRAAGAKRCPASRPGDQPTASDESKCDTIDGNFSGWLYLLILIPILGGLAIFVLLLLPANPAGARFDKVQAWPTAQPTA